MSRTWRRILIAGLVPAAAAGSLLLAGCGEKIAVPQPKGEFSISQYHDSGVFPLSGARQVTIAQGALFVITADSLSKRDLDFVVQDSLGGLADARAVCADAAGDWIFVWEEGAHRISWFSREDLTPGGSTILDGPTGVASLVTSPVGLEVAPGALTFLYLSSPTAGRVWRYAFDVYNGLTPVGLLTRSGSEAVRYVHVPEGLARDLDGNLLVCDGDSLRNWVIHFDPTPDEADPDLLGLAMTFGRTSNCPAPAVDEYVIGNAPSCGETDWTGGVSDALGEFDRPHGVAVDGGGHIYVTDTGNDRVQVFDNEGLYTLDFGSDSRTPSPTSIAVVDRRNGPLPDDFAYGALLYLALPDRGEVRRYISYEYYIYLNRKPPPEDQ